MRNTTKNSIFTTLIFSIVILSFTSCTKDVVTAENLSSKEIEDESKKIIQSWEWDRSCFPYVIAVVGADPCTYAKLVPYSYTLDFLKNDRYKLLKSGTVIESGKLETTQIDTYNAAGKKDGTYGQITFNSDAPRVTNFFLSDKASVKTSNPNEFKLIHMPKASLTGPTYCGPTARDFFYKKVVRPS